MPRLSIGRIRSHAAIETAAIESIDAKAIVTARNERLALRQRAFKDEFPRELQELGETIYGLFELRRDARAAALHPRVWPIQICVRNRRHLRGVAEDPGETTRVKELIESFIVWLAWKLPRALVYWCFVRVVTENCLGNPGDRSAHDAAESWNSRPAPRTLEQELHEPQPASAKQEAIATMKHVHRVCNQALDSGNWIDTATARSLRDAVSKAWTALEQER